VRLYSAFGYTFGWAMHNKKAYDLPFSLSFFQDTGEIGRGPTLRIGRRMTPFAVLISTTRTLSSAPEQVLVMRPKGHC